MVSTVPPTQCGIATFAESLAQAVTDAGVRIDLVDVSPGAPRPPAAAHRHGGEADLARTAALLNSYDVVLLQHEFGIWDGPDGRGIVDLLRHLYVPVISVLHTVPETATDGQRAILQTLLHASDTSVVLSRSAEQRLRGQFAIRDGMLRAIPHGAPSLSHLRSGRSATHPRRVLTWGLLGPGKGIEWGIRAVAALWERGVPVEYVVAGATHPEVLRTDGELYRDGLRHLATDLGVGPHVSFIDDYLTSDERAELIGSAAAYLLPYDSREQVTSGVLVEALAAGGPVVATRFPHAVELLANGTGVLARHRDPSALADGLELVLTDPAIARTMRARSRATAEAFSWVRVSDSYLELADGLWRGRGAPRHDSRPWSLIA